tara:strand:- start:227 stop:337 length:111 start_codon:yes stop_codon:yes gene_type:complete
MGVREADSTAIGCDTALDEVFDDDIKAPPENKSVIK